MDYSSKAYTVIGLRVDNSKLTTTKRVRGCEHDLGPNKKAKFCTECGVSAWVEEEKPIKGYDPEDCDEDGDQVIAGFKVVEPNGEAGEFFVAGLLLEGETGEHGYRTSVDIPAIKAKMKTALMPLGLWDETEFGLWAILHESF